MIPLQFWEHTPKSALESLPVIFTRNMAAITFTHFVNGSCELKKIQGQFLAPYPGPQGFLYSGRSPEERSLLLEAVRIARTSVVGNFVSCNNVTAPGSPTPTELNRAVDEIVSTLWGVSFKDNTSHFTKLLGEMDKIPVAKSRQKSLVESERKLREALSRLAENLLATQVSNQKYTFFVYLCTIISKSKFFSHLPTDSISGQ